MATKEHRLEECIPILCPPPPRPQFNKHATSFHLLLRRGSIGGVPLAGAGVHALEPSAQPGALQVRQALAPGVQRPQVLIIAVTVLVGPLHPWAWHPRRWWVREKVKSMRLHPPPLPLPNESCRHQFPVGRLMRQRLMAGDRVAQLFLGAD